MDVDNVTNLESSLIVRPSWKRGGPLSSSECANKFSSAFSVEHFDAFHSDTRFRVIALTKK